MRPRFTIPLQKALPTEDAEGLFTKYGMAVMHAYAKAWRAGKRSAEIERAHPELAGPFYDVRSDPEVAEWHAR